MTSLRVHSSSRKNERVGTVVQMRHIEIKTDGPLEACRGIAPKIHESGHSHVQLPAPPTIVRRLSDARSVVAGRIRLVDLVSLTCIEEPPAVGLPFIPNHRQIKSCF